MAKSRSTSSTSGNSVEPLNSSVGLMGHVDGLSVDNMVSDILSMHIQSEAKQEKYDRFYMDIATRAAEMSHCVRLKVGAVIVSGDRIVSMGWNGTPFGMDNCCEAYDESGNLVSKPEVIHAESNAILKVAASSDSCLGAKLYVTHAPCVECAKQIIRSGITAVLYRERYRCASGLNLLADAGIYVRQI